MKISVKEVTEGNLDGQYVWICDYRFTDLNDKPIRSVLPQRVLVRPNTETKERVHYSESHFVPLNTKGHPASKIIKVYDNTWYRSYPGVSVNIFSSEEECLECFREQKSVVLSELQSWFDQKKARYEALKNELQG